MGSGQPPFFYHILMNPSSPHLPLPTSFVKKHLRNRILKDPILKSANGGYSWKLKMKKFDGDDHGFCFVNGWCKVVKDIGLLFGEFLLFKYVGSSVFLMHVYSVNGCEKILVPRTNFKAAVEVSVEDDEVVFGDDDVEEDNDDDDDDDMEYGMEEDDAEEDEEDDVDVELGDDGDDDDGEDEDYVDIDGDDGDPYFVITSSKRNKDKLRFPPDLVAWATIKTKETITLKNDDGFEKEMPVRSYKQNKSTRYYVAEGWKEFQRSNDISEGDECVLKFIKSEDKLCLAKVTKKKPRVTEVDNDDMDDDDGMDEKGEAEYAKDDDYNVDGDDIFDDDVDEDGKGEDANFVVDDDEDDDVDANGDEGKGESAKLVNDGEDDEDDDRDDGNLSFILTSSNKNQYKLWFSPDFAALAGINTKKTITLKNLDGYEKELRVKSHRRKHGKKYFLSPGWKEFQRNSNISAGDKFVIKFITSEDKFCLAKITKNKTLARPLPPAAEAPVTEVDDGMDDQDVDDNDGDGMDEEGKGEDAKFVVDDDEDDDVDVNGDEGKGEAAKLVNHDMDDEDDTDEDAKDGDSNVEGDDIFDDDVDEEGESEDDELVENDGDPSFTATSLKTNQFKLWFSADFVELAGINTKKTITLKNLDGYEKELRVKSQKRKHGQKYFLSPGWKEFKQDSNISEGDKFVFKFVTREDKFCLAKINDHDDEDLEDDKDENEDVQPVDGRDPFFVVNITKSHNFMLWLPQDFVELAGIDGKENIIIKRPDGNERQMVLRPVKQLHSTRYTLSKGWRAFMRSNNILEGDECVFTYITSEDKMCLAKVTKEKTPPTEVDDNDLKVDDGMDGKDVVVDDNKDEDENLDLVDDGMDGKDVVVDENKDEDENVELVDGIDGKDVVVDDNKDRDENVELVDDGMDGKDVVVDDNKQEDENVELVNDGMDGKDVVVDDSMHEDEHIELVDDGLDIDAYDNKDEDKDTEFVDGHPFFVVTMTPSHESKLGLPTVFVASAGIASKKNIIMKSLDGNETKMSIRTDKRRYVSAQYHLSVGWRAFKQSNNISEGDECVFKYIASENKMCLAKITKKENVNVDDNMDKDENVELVDNGMDVKADDNKDDKDVERVNDGMDDKDVDEYVKLVDGMDFKDTDFDKNNDEDENENENVELVDDGMDDKDVDEYVKLVDGMDDKDVEVDDNKDENEDAEHVDDEDPFFRVTITLSHKSMLRLPPDFVGLAGINTKKDIIIKSPDGNESRMALRSDRRFNSAQYHLAGGWVAFKQRNNLSLGDECVFKYITSEDKLSLAKITKTWVTEADTDPFFVVTISPCHRSNLWLPEDFVGLAGIDTKENIIVKSLDGNETQIALRSNLCKKKQLTRYCLSIGWGAFKRTNNISEGDDCEFKYITNEDKMCLAKVTKEKTPIRLPSPAEVVKRKRGRLPPAAEIKMTVAENVKMRSRRSPPVEITVAESVKRKRGPPPPLSPLVTKDVKRKKGQR